VYFVNAWDIRDVELYEFHEGVSTKLAVIRIDNINTSASEVRRLRQLWHFSPDGLRACSFMFGPFLPGEYYQILEFVFSREEDGTLQYELVRTPMMDFPFIGPSTPEVVVNIFGVDYGFDNQLLICYERGFGVLYAPSGAHYELKINEKVLFEGSCIDHRETTGHYDSQGWVVDLMECTIGGTYYEIIDMDLRIPVVLFSRLSTPPTRTYTFTGPALRESYPAIHDVGTILYFDGKETILQRDTAFKIEYTAYGGVHRALSPKTHFPVASPDPEENAMATASRCATLQIGISASTKRKDIRLNSNGLLFVRNPRCFAVTLENFFIDPVGYQHPEYAYTTWKGWYYRDSVNRLYLRADESMEFVEHDLTEILRSNFEDPSEVPPYALVFPFRAA